MKSHALSLLLIFLLPIGLITFALLSLRPSPALATMTATYTVTKTADTNDGVCDADCSLREAIIAANNNPGVDTIIVPAGVYLLTIAGPHEDEAATGDLDITDDLILHGDGIDQTIIDGNQLDRILHIHDSNVQISGMTIRNGDISAHTQAAGGGILVDRGTLFLENVKVTANKAWRGGGIAVLDNGRLELDNSEVSNNEIRGFVAYGGGVYVASGYHENEESSITVSNSVVRQNLAIGDGNPPVGGGIMVHAPWAQPVTATITSSVIEYNTIDYWTSCGAGEGGGIFFDSGDNLEYKVGGLSIIDTVIRYNVADTPLTVCDGPYAGGVFFRGDRLSVENSQIISNTALSRGGIWILTTYQGESYLITNSSISYNQAVAGSGGGLTAYVRPDGVREYQLQIEDSIISHNATTYDGGGASLGGNVIMTNTIIAHNSAGGDGGGLTGGGRLIRSAIHHNSAGGDGGGIHQLFNVLLDASVVHHNVAGGSGGGLIMAAAYNPPPVADILNSTISYNTAAEAGAIHHAITSANGCFGAFVHLKNSTIAYNTGTTAVGGLLSDPGGLDIPKCTPSGFPGILGQTTLVNTLLAHNSGGNCNIFTSDQTVSLGHNLSDDATCLLQATGDMVRTGAHIGPLQDNGGNTLTHALLEGSPAIDGGTDTHCPPTDQRGFVRPYGASCDIGAFEAEILQPYLYVNPKSLTFTAVAGADNPLPQVINVANSGAGELTWTASETIPWLTLSANSGAAPAAVSVMINSSGLSAGSYTGNIIFESAAMGSPQTVTVTLHIVDIATVIKNGDFELGRDGSWQNEYLLAEAAEFSQYTPPHSGNWSALMGGTNGFADSISQPIMLPSGGDDLVLNYYYFSQSDETECQWDKAEVRLNQTVVATHELCIANNTANWVMNSINITAFAGQEVNLQFYVETDILFNPSVFLLDDVSVGYIRPSISANYMTGAPGSHFTFTAADFPPNSPATISVNGHFLTTVNTNASGEAAFVLHTGANMLPGFYNVSFAVNPSASVTIKLDPTAPVRPLEGDAPIIDVPDSILPIEERFIYLPIVVR
jgi:CSLREA domain-containing protein